MSSSQLETIVSLGAGLIVSASVVALASRMSRTIFEPAHHSIATEDLNRITDKYGKWAARRAQAFCPENDVACVEREAKRLYEVVTHRR